MITVTILGLDQYIVGNISKDVTPLLASLYEVSEDEINFVAPSVMVFHKGVEQTSWNTIVRVHLPLKVKVLQDKAAKLLMETIVGPTINVSLEFYYYSQDDRYEKINPEYPRFITDKNEVSFEENDEELEEGEEDNQIYTGDIFKDFNSK